MALYDVDLALKNSAIKVTVFNVPAEHLNQAITEARKYVKNPLDWYSTGIDKSQGQTGDTPQGAN
ncbi:hypothetical protein D3C81_1170400 [compost metagenome]